jgi:hypothetical protein
MKNLSGLFTERFLPDFWVHKSFLVNTVTVEKQIQREPCKIASVEVSNSYINVDVHIFQHMSGMEQFVSCPRRITVKLTDAE